MKIYFPCKTNIITQGFGVENTAGWMLPVYQKLGLKGHDGLDIGVVCKRYDVKVGGQCENLYNNVCGDGDLTITFVQKDVEKGFGLIAVDEKWNKFLWWHLDSFDPLIFVGQKLKFGQLIGVSGTTGNSTGPHCHFAYYPYGEDYNNGYHGAVSPAPYFDPRFCLTIKSQIDIIQKLLEILNALLKLFKK